MHRHDALSRILQTSNVPHGTIVWPDPRTCGDIDGYQERLGHAGIPWLHRVFCAFEPIRLLFLLVELG